MELHDYLRMLRRGWPTIILLIVLCVGSSFFYLVVTPKQYTATAVVFIAPKAPKSVSDLEEGTQYAIGTAASYADIINSATVLGPAVQKLPSSYSVSQLQSMVVATPRPETALIDVNATAGSPADAANVANAAARTAVQVVPGIAEGDRKNATLVTLTLTRQASPPTAPVSPNSKHILVLGFVIGLALGFGLAISRQALDTRLRRREDLEPLTHLPVLTVVPKLNRQERAGVVVRDDPASVPVESFRALRTNLRHLEPEARRSLLVAGASKARDDAQVPVNLAWSIAQTGRRVLLVDVDLRQSLIGEMLQLPGSLGMTDVLAGDVNLADVVQTTSQPNLHVIVSGRTGDHPSDLLSGTNMHSVLRLAEEQYDYVILHAPPLLRYTDGAVLSTIASHTLVTISAGQTRAVDLSAALGVLHNVHVEPLGIVLGGVRGVRGEFRRIRGLGARTPKNFPLRRNIRSAQEFAAARVARRSAVSIVGGIEMRPGPETAAPAARQHLDDDTADAVAPSADGAPAPTGQLRRFRGVRARTPADFPRRRNARASFRLPASSVERPPAASPAHDNIAGRVSPQTTAVISRRRPTKSRDERPKP